MGGTPIPAARSPADTVGVRGASPEENLKKRSQMVASDGIFGKDIDLKILSFFYIFCKISKLNTATKLKIELYQVII